MRTTMTHRWPTLLLSAVLLIAAAVGRAVAQDPGDAEAERLRQTIQERYEDALRRELGLDDQQATRLRLTTREFAQRRLQIFRDERQARAALGAQMRPGVAADQDSVARLTERITRLRGDLARSYDDELQALDFLTPVQRARYLQLRERLLQRVREARERRQERGLLPRDRPRRGSMRGPRAGGAADGASGGFDAPF